jgi:Zn-dependent peptidase ImmA (M78 family)
MNKQQIKKAVAHIVQQHETRDPYRIVCNLGYQILFEHLGSVYGYFSNFCRVKLIHINRDIDEDLWPFICAHELAHSILHTDTGTHAMNAHSLLMTAGIEREANQFAVELLLPDEMIREHANIGIYDLCKISGIPAELAWLK